VSVKPNCVGLRKCERPALFLSSPWFSPIFWLVPIRGILCVFCSRHLSFYIVYSVLVSNFMSHDISSEISSSPRPCSPFLKASWGKGEHESGSPTSTCGFIHGKPTGQVTHRSESLGGTGLCRSG